MGIRARMGVMRTLKPVRMAIISEVTLCSLTPRNCGFSPGMDVELSFTKDWMWLIEGMVLAINQGSPKTEETTTIRASTRRSRW